MPGDTVKIIIDNIYNKRVPKPSNLRSRYDMEHVFKYRPQTDNYRYEKVVKIEKEYDYLSIIRPYETPQQWANRVREGITKPYYSHVNGELIDIPYEYRRPRVHKSEMAICFDCWKLVKITEVKPKKVYFDGYRRWSYEVKSEDLIKNHWNYSRFEAKTEEVPLEPNKSYSLTSSKEKKLT
ncbi:hypothetical protein C2G38_2208732 [Gigaspora rosea]|uniref:Uncharacterized protein n=1 Tax=Gigaspora rosea TaxID=44941 RepID=A0A397UJW0_9GLOM|nr:hypothetical protein C2G38_2208732 [Gigaspora rosea]